MEAFKLLKGLNSVRKATTKSPSQNSDLGTALLIIVIFIALYISSFLAIGLKKIKENWNQYRCSPMAMPFAGYLGYDALENFAFCIGKIQSGLMNTFLKPIFSNLNILGDVAGSIVGSIRSLTVLMSNMNVGFGMASFDILSMFKGIMVKMQYFIVNIKDVLSKFGGTMSVMSNIIEGSSLTARSMWRGPVGETLRTLCFSPNTLVTMNDGSKKKMKDIVIGETLENGVDVIATLKIKGGTEHCFYKIWSKSLNEYIYVTGSHKIINPENGELIPVEVYKFANKTNKYSDTLTCLITSNHIIPVGEFKFWDWED
jgi:hypothetical protein